MKVGSEERANCHGARWRALKNNGKGKGKDNSLDHLEGKKKKPLKINDLFFQKVPFLS